METIVWGIPLSSIVKLIICSFGVLFYISGTLLQAKVKEREEATQKSLDRIKQLYQEEDASK